MTSKNDLNFFDRLPEPSVESSERWVRVQFGGETIADSKHPILLLQYGPGLLPTYFFSRETVRMDLLEAGEEKDDRRYWTVKVNDTEAQNAAWSYINPSAKLADLQDHVTFQWNKMDAWYEEEEQVFVHARDPHKRVDVMPSSRHVRIVIDGKTIAETNRPHLLFETSLPTRYYIPSEDVRMEFLQPSTMSSQCPYKGIASYWSVKTDEHPIENVVWSYQNPIPEIPKIKGLLSFFNEKVDMYIDGELQPKPLTPWS